MRAVDVIVVTHEVGGAPEVSMTITHKRSGLAVWDCGADAGALRERLLAELAGRVAREWRPAVDRGEDCAARQGAGD